MPRRRRKPKVIEPGKCYRMNAFYGLGDPSDLIVYVYAIEGVRQRFVRVRAVGEHELGYNAESYSEFKRRVYCEEPTVMN